MLGGGSEIRWPANEDAIPDSRFVAGGQPTKQLGLDFAQLL